MAIYYKGAADAHFTPLCPVVIRPGIWVTEEVETELGEAHRRRAQTRRVLGTVSLRIHEGSRGFALGAVLTGALGVLASFPLLARILFPRLTARIRHKFGRLVETPPLTRLRVERTQASPGPADAACRLQRRGDDRRGRAVAPRHRADPWVRPALAAARARLAQPEQSARLGPQLRGLRRRLRRAERPHHGPDLERPDGCARAWPQRGLSLPDDTVVVGGYHNTCDDSVTYYDVDRIPASHRREFETAREEIELTCERNAHERCRRFYSAPLTLSFTAAREHVEGRAEDLAQVRPEFGHCTNAITIVGRREWSRGLFLDRRAFLTSYDPTEDDADRTILTRILQAVFPVCSGISLEYYFSNVDNVGFGCGTKLPHNLASLLGVMDGAASDLRTGLPWQMVEIHEPVRSLFLIETTPEAMLRIMDRNPGIGRLCRNGWVLLARDRPRDPRAQRFRGRRVSSVSSPRPRCCPRRPPPSTGIAAGATTSNSRRSCVKIARARRGGMEVMTYEPLLQLLGLIVVVSPLLLTIVLGVSSLLDWKLPEPMISNLVQATIVSGLLAATLVLVLMLTTGTRHVAIDVGDWVAIPHLYHFSVKFVFDRLSVPFAILSFVLAGTIGAFASKYMHRERGFNRFFMLYSIFVLGMEVTALAGTIETLFAGWELVGLSSALLVAFYQERPAPARNGLWVWIIYRVSDASLLLASVVMHHLRAVKATLTSCWGPVPGPMRSRP